MQTFGCPIGRTGLSSNAQIKHRRRKQEPGQITVVRHNPRHSAVRQYIQQQVGCKKIELTARSLKELQPIGGERTEYFDENLPGFSVRVSPTADLDGDGAVDLVVYNEERQFGWRRNDGSGGFAAPERISGRT